MKIDIKTIIAEMANVVHNNQIMSPKEIESAFNGKTEVSLNDITF